MQAARLACFARAGTVARVPTIKRSLAYDIWSDLAVLMYAAMSQPLENQPRKELRRALTPRTNGEPNVPHNAQQDWRMFAYKKIAYCIGNALSIQHSRTTTASGSGRAVDNHHWK